jgi:hypothetical protein
MFVFFSEFSFFFSPLQTHPFFSLFLDNEVGVEGFAFAVNCVKSLKSLESLNLACLFICLFVCWEIQTLIFSFFFLVAEHQIDFKGRKLINEAAALNGCVKIEWE